MKDQQLGDAAHCDFSLFGITKFVRACSDTQGGLKEHDLTFPWRPNCKFMAWLRRCTSRAENFATWVDKKWQVL